MSLFFGETEITNIDNLVPQAGLDITDMWFGSTNVYTVWETYEGTLPATINANGADMRQYQIYGNTGGVGDRTVNYFDISAQTQIDVTGTGTMRTGVYLGFLAVGQYTLTFDAPHNYSLFITRKNGNTYTYQDVNKSQLPFTFSVNSGDEIIVRTGNTLTFEQQQFTNICVTSGTTPPETYVPFGYELDMGVKSGNLFDKSSAVVYNAYISTGDIWTNSANAKSIKIRVKPSTTYTISTFKELSIFRIAESDDENVEPSSESTVTNIIRLTNATNSTFMTTANAKTLIFQGENDNYQDWINSLMIKEGNLMPTKYQSYSNTTTLIYIGDEPLDKDEYVDYGAQKVYRMIDGTLTPTDPPVALPALPTCDGETVMDYAGQSVAPEKVMLKYRKEGF